MFFRSGEHILTGSLFAPPGSGFPRIFANFPVKRGISPVFLRAEMFLKPLNRADPICFPTYLRGFCSFLWQ